MHLVLGIGLALLMTLTHAQATGVSVLESLPRLLYEASPGKDGNNFEYQIAPEGWTVTYCPDNKCDLIRAPTTIDETTLGDFTLLYLYYVSGFIYLEPFYEGEAKSIVEATMAHRPHGCTEKAPIAKAACILNAIATEEKISLSFVTSDEGEKSEQAVRIDETLNVHAIEETKNWQLSQWR